MDNHIIYRKVKEYLDSVVIRNGQKWIDGNVELYGSGLTELNFQDIFIKGHFFCDNNQLKTLEGSPKEVGGYFYCYNNRLTTLEGSPNKVGGDFDCSNNQLTTLKGLNEVEGYIYTHPIKNCDYYLQYSLMDKIRLID